MDFKTFNRMPAGTIFAPYTPCTLEDSLSIKTSKGWEINYPQYGNWMFNGVMPLEPTNLDSIFDEKSVKASFKTYDGDSNDYCDCDKFLIFEKCDIDRLIQVLLWAKGGCKDENYIKFCDEFK